MEETLTYEERIAKAEKMIAQADAEFRTMGKLPPQEEGPHVALHMAIGFLRDGLKESNLDYVACAFVLLRYMYDGYAKVIRQ